MEEGCRIVSPYFVVFTMPGLEHGHRAGIRISRKLGGAVKRNRLRRILKETLRNNLSAAVPGQDIVIITRSACLKQSVNVLKQSMIRILEEENLLDRQ
ncbi:MAG: ribonuclease P protein component [Chloroflexi bacterium]|nr:ribonuclease P protein component [Chloroflexota bacterium]